jgi:D-mannonate dehydratase
LAQINTVGMGGPNRAISLGLPERGAEIEAWQHMIRAMGEVGIGNIFYNFKPSGNHRTASAVGRGGAQLSTFNYKAWQVRCRGAWTHVTLVHVSKFSRHPIASAATHAAQPADPHRWFPISGAPWQTEYDGSRDAPVSAEQIWASLRFFLAAVVPVAERAGVRLALHPEDPPVLEALGQAAHITSTLDQYERVFEMVPSRSNAMAFCQGCVTEMGEAGRGGSIADAIRRMVSQDKVTGLARVCLACATVH